MFTHLHVHSEYSPLDGMGKIEEIVLRAKELGQKAIAVTDHGSMAGHFELEKMCNKHGIKPIFGNEFYMSIGEKRAYEKIKDRGVGRIADHAEHQKFLTEKK